MTSATEAGIVTSSAECHGGGQVVHAPVSAIIKKDNVNILRQMGIE